MGEPVSTPSAAVERGSREHTFSLTSLFAIVGFVAIFLAGTALDVHLTGYPGSIAGLVLGRAHASGDTLIYVAQIIAAVLGIALTVVAIVVQLAANRYTAKIIDLFIRDPVNVPTLALFVVSTLEAIWVAHTHRPDFVPRTGIFVTMVLATASLLVLVPYFRHVFTFIEPQNVIRRIRREVIRQIDATIGLAGPVSCVGSQLKVVESIDHLFDIARNSIGQVDRSLAVVAIFALRDVVLEAGRQKPRLPDAWFHIPPAVRKNADFVNFPTASLADFEAERTWLERKILWQLCLVFSAAQQSARGVSSTVALAVREIGEAALARGARAELRLTVRAFNSLMRATLNQKDVRTTFNVLQHYRLFAEELVAAREAALSQDVLGHFRYYGRVAERAGLGFVLETVTHDVSLLVKAAVLAGEDEQVVRGYLATALDLDDDDEAPLTAETRAGVRRAQVVLAAFFLAHGRDDLARVIFEDMHAEPRSVIDVVRAQIRAAEREFFELTERVSTFGYVDPTELPFVEQFLAWLDASAPAIPESGRR